MSRIIHDIEADSQVAGYSRGNKIELTIVSGEEEIHIHGGFKKVRAALVEALAVLDAHEEVSRMEQA